MTKQKKTYTAPTVTEHGNGTEETKGLGGEFWEYLNPTNNPAIDPKD
ncbi:hypothetical protein BH23GEM10_BH23GEM10_17950 [soil metagenome]